MEQKLIPGSEPVLINGNDTGVLLLHGFTGSPHEMLPVAQALQEDNYTISVPLLSGHGYKPSALKTVKWYDWFEDAKQTLFALRKSCKQIFVGGLSTGASLALHLSAHYQVEGVLALSPALYLKNKMSGIVPFIPPIVQYRRKKGGPDISDPEARAQSISYNKMPIKAIKQLLKLYEHLEHDLPEIYAPALIIQSVQDHVVDFRSARWIYDHISSSDKQFLKLQKSFHVVTQDVEKDIVIREIKQFISSRCKNSV